MRSKTLIFLAVLASAVTISYSQYGNFDDIPGRFCKLRDGSNRCCNNRDDSCSEAIMGTLCYCDQFCNRTINPDCCPDYWDVCLNLPNPGVGEFRKGDNCSSFTGEIIQHGEKTTYNCNPCKCEKGTLTCEKNQCLINENILNELESDKDAIGWTHKNYSYLWGHKLYDGLLMMTGTLKPDDKSFKMYPIKLHYKLENIPLEFDARQQWPHLARVKDQGWCGASWAFSTISVAQDRLTIASNQTEDIEWSVQNLLSCNRRGQQACQGGHVERAWAYLRKHGVVSEDCYPYESGVSAITNKCKVHKDATLKSIDCAHKQFPRDREELYSTEPAYRISSKESDIMWEILTNGPVQAIMKVYQDFLLYGQGIYSRTTVQSMDDTKYHLHSVKIIGWGEQPNYNEEPVKYWLAQNSWGTKWGEDGMFKIRRGTNESGIEEFILTVRSRLSEEAKTLARHRKRSAKKHHSKKRSHHKYYY